MDDGKTGIRAANIILFIIVLVVLILVIFCLLGQAFRQGCRGNCKCNCQRQTKPKCGCNQGDDCNVIWAVLGIIILIILLIILGWSIVRGNWAGVIAFIIVLILFILYWAFSCWTCNSGCKKGGCNKSRSRDYDETQE